MKKAERKRFARDLMKALTRQAIEAAANMPNEFDGHEIRAFIADLAARERTTMSRDRRREYENAATITNDFRRAVP